MDYKNHRIEVSIRVAANEDHWSFDAFVTYNDDGTNVLKILRAGESFSAPGDAEKAGLELAQKWIDEGKLKGS